MYFLLKNQVSSECKIEEREKVIEIREKVCKEKGERYKERKGEGIITFHLILRC